MQDPALMQRDRAIEYIAKGKEYYNQHRDNYQQMKKGFDLFLAGLKDLSEYTKKESNPVVLAQVKQMLEAQFVEAEGMKNYLKQLQAQNQANQNNQFPTQNIMSTPSQELYSIMGNRNNGQGAPQTAPLGNSTIKVGMPPPPPPHPSTNSGDNNSEPQKVPVDSADKKKDSEEDKFKAALESTIQTEKPNVHWEDVAGLEFAKQALKEAVILPIKFPQMFTGSRTPWRGILLYGPPGTGKTFLAKACATECDATFFSISAADLISKWVGESERMIKMLFKLAREKAPSVIFIDEVDSMTGNREGGGSNESSGRVKTQFLVEMQGVGNDQTGVLVLGATNIPWGLDPAIRRRFEKRIYIALPDIAARKSLIINLLSKNEHTLTPQDIDQIAYRTEGFSGADLSVMMRDAAYQPLRLCQSATKFKQVYDPTGLKWMPCAPSDPEGVEKNFYAFASNELKLPPMKFSDFDDVLAKVKSSVSKADIENQVKFTKEFGMEG